MTKNRRYSVVMAMCMMFLILGISNHCVLEDLFVSLVSKSFGLELPNHVPNHLGSTSEHKHNDSSESHEHGQPHPVVVLNTQKSDVDFVTLVALLLPFTFLSVFALRSTLRDAKTLGTVRPTGDPPGYLRLCILSLTSAPQAPPASA